MTQPTVDRADAVMGRIARLDGDSAPREAVALGLVDALLHGDGASLSALLDALRDARARSDDQNLLGWLDAAIAVAYWGLERSPSSAVVGEGTQAHDFLHALAGSSQLGSAEMRTLLGVDETQVSRTGRRLLERGLVTRRKVGRQVFWQLTPRGQRALDQAPPAKRPRNLEFWHEAIRRGFQAASGDVPGEPREVDPTRERIIECALDLHLRQGIQATTPAEVAKVAGVPLATLETLFPTRDDLVRGCGAHFTERLQLPPRELAPAVFAGAESETERIQRLVGTFFRAYERGGDGLALARRERDLPVVNESVEALDDTFDALVTAALGPVRADGASVASLRALTDVEVWRTLRDQGATPDAAVDQVSGAVERWLEGQRAR